MRIRHLLDLIYTDIGEAAIREKVVQPLTGLRVAPYYGCQVVRPMNGFDSTEYPMKMDELFTWLGAEVVDYPVKAHCCGGHMTQISEDAAFELIRRLLDSAVEYEADLILCMCPMCQLNLDAYQGRVRQPLQQELPDADHLLHAVARRGPGPGLREAGNWQGDCGGGAGDQGQACCRSRRVRTPRRGLVRRARRHGPNNNQPSLLRKGG